MTARRAKKGLRLPLERSFVEQIAKIIGPYSAAAQALADADAHDGPVEFWQGQQFIIVVKHPKEVQS